MTRGEPGAIKGSRGVSRLLGIWKGAVLTHASSVSCLFIVCCPPREEGQSRNPTWQGERMVSPTAQGGIWQGQEEGLWRCPNSLKKSFLTLLPFPTFSFRETPPPEAKVKKTCGMEMKGLLLMAKPVSHQQASSSFWFRFFFNKLNFGCLSFLFFRYQKLMEGTGRSWNAKLLRRSVLLPCVLQSMWLWVWQGDQIAGKKITSTCSCGTLFWGCRHHVRGLEGKTSPCMCSFSVRLTFF